MTTSTIPGFTTIADDRGNTYVQPLPTPRQPDNLPGWAYNDPATHVCLWFNRDTRDWVVSLSDERGQQIGDSIYCASRLWALDEVADILAGTGGL